MRVPRIYTQQNLIEGRELELDGAASHHLVTVLRMAAGRSVCVFNGDGEEYEATIVELRKKIAVLKIGSSREGVSESPLRSTLAVGISRGDRFDFALQKATELGVHCIVPLFCERSEVKLTGDRLDKKMDAWKKIIIGACEQSGRVKLPDLSASHSFVDYAASEKSALKLVLHHRADKKLSALPKPDSVAVLIGPEGGLSETEIQLAQQQGFQALRLGPRVLRTETAPLAALTTLQLLWGDFA